MYTLKTLLPRESGAANPVGSVLLSTNGRIMYLCDDWCVWPTDLGARRFEMGRQRKLRNVTVEQTAARK